MIEIHTSSITRNSNNYYYPEGYLQPLNNSITHYLQYLYLISNYLSNYYSSLR